MEAMGTKTAAALIGVSIQRFHRLTVTHQIRHVFQATGRTGEKFWLPADVARLDTIVNGEGEVA